MNRALGVVLLLPLLPLIGAYWSRALVVIGSVVAFLGVAATGIMIEPESAQLVFFAQLLPLFVTSVAGFHFSARHSRESDGAVAHRDELEKLSQRHAALKKEVSENEQREGHSLQIYGVARGLAEALSWKDMAPRLTAGIQKLFNAYEFLVYTIDEKNKWSLLHRRGSWSKEPPLKDQSPAQSTFFYPPQVAEVVPVLAVPIYLSSGGERRMNGMLYLKSSQADRNEDLMKEIGNDVGEQLGIALNKAILFSQMELHSRVDGLTGALRRQAFMDRLAEELKKSSVFKTPFSVMMVDIDFFKHVNDSHGHAAGDAVLSRVGAVLKECFYETDVVGRYGGEEFIVLLPRAEAAGVVRKAEALRQRLEKETIMFGFEKLKITVSIGIANFPHDGRTGEELIAAADKRLYHAKETGRNKVVAA